jgi:hypothetical protein
MRIGAAGAARCGIERTAAGGPRRPFAAKGTLKGGRATRVRGTANQLPDGERSPFRDITFILHGKQWEMVDAAIELAIKPRDPNSPDRSPQGNALAAICAEYLAVHAER